MRRIIALTVLCLLQAAFGWNGYSVKEGAYGLDIAEVAEVNDPSKPFDVTLTLSNKSPLPVSATVKVHKLADDWKVAGEAEREIDIPAKQSVDVVFQLISGPKVYSMPYPVHVQARIHGQEACVLNAVRIFAVNIKKASDLYDKPPEMPVLTLAKDSHMRLLEKRDFVRVAWQFFDEPWHYRSVGWTGHDTVSRASVNFSSATCDGVSRHTISVHPPYRDHPGQLYDCGPVCCDFRVKLPDQKPLSLTFHHAERMNRPDETVSDGVLYRVWATADGGEPKCLYSNFTDSKKWVAGQADLSEFAGKTILLRLESHPGPNKNVYTDGNYWGEPVLHAGDVKTVKTTNIAGMLGDWNTVSENIAFHGFEVELDKLSLNSDDSQLSISKFDELREGDILVHRYHIAGEEKAAVLDIRRIPVHDGMRYQLHCDGMRISRVWLGGWRDIVETLYYGHGYVIRKPGDVRLGFGGHNFASSHIGMEFGEGPAVLVAVDNPPSILLVNPTEHHCTPVTSDNCTFTVLSAPTAFQAAIRYQDLMDKQAAPTFKRLTGRMLFDIWGGSFASILSNMKTAVKYGMTDSVLTMHNWQRWGYDYRLPDIWPPNPRVGNVADLQAIGKLCDDNGILWGLHDNCTDFYPDADDFSIKRTFFWQKDGAPAKGWYNKGRDAQAMWFRPDATLPFVHRNYTEMRKSIQPTHAFVDVLTSVSCIEYYDDEGHFHSSLDTRQAWRDIFNEIRSILGENTTTTSEAGSDQLIGYLAGADCQWLGINGKGGFVNRFPCDSWERVPWNDAVNHSRFAWQGVGYSTRYQASGFLTREEHGSGSDDYLSAVLLSGHSLMVDVGDWGFQAVRTYWLGQEFIRFIAGRKMTKHEFADGDIHRQFVEWDNGARILVNRGETNWTVNGHTLPQYGYYAEFGDGGVVALEIVDGLFREYSKTATSFYCNVRSEYMNIKAALFADAQPMLGGLTLTQNGNLAYELHWKVKSPTEENWRTYVHFRNAKGDIAFQDDHMSHILPTQWPANGEVVEKRTISPADDKLTEEKYEMNVGLYTRELRLIPMRLNDRVATTAHVGTLYVEREADGKLKELRLEPVTLPPPLKIHVNPARTALDFGLLKTDGVCRLYKLDDGWEVVPAPDLPPFDIDVNLDQLFHGRKRISVAMEMQNGETKPMADATDGRIVLKATKDIFRFVLRENHE
jgi:hypothetical protein